MSGVEKNVPARNRGVELNVSEISGERLSQLQDAEKERDLYRYALEGIRGAASDEFLFIHQYREAGGGYEGLQAIAEAALTSGFQGWRFPES